MPDEPDHYTTLLSIAGRDSKHLYALANLAPTVDDPDSIWSVVIELSHKPEVLWKRTYMMETWLTSMGQSSEGYLYAVSMDGDLHTNRTGSWVVHDLDCPAGLNAIWVTSDTEIFAVGEVGKCVRWSGGNTDVFDRIPRVSLNAIHGRSASDVYAVGDEGEILRYNGSTWSEIESPCNHSLFSVLCVSEADMYIAGAGVLFRTVGQEWEDLHCPPNIEITSLAVYHNELYAAAGEDGIYRLGREGLNKVKTLAIYELNVIEDLLFGIGGQLVVQFDGRGWWGGNLDL